MTKKPGRPKGSKTAERPTSDELLSRCPVCLTTERVNFNGDEERIEGEGIAPDGHPYTAVILKPTKCSLCGQARYVRRWEYIPK